MQNLFQPLIAQLSGIDRWQTVGRVTALTAGLVEVEGFASSARIGDQVSLQRHDIDDITGEIIQLDCKIARVMPHSPAEQVPIGTAAVLEKGRAMIAPDPSWIGRVIDAFGKPIDGKPLANGSAERAVQAPAPAAGSRGAFGERLNTGSAALNTFLPIVRGQRLGLFAGAGVGKSTLLAGLCRDVEADVIVLAMVGERGRELRHFVEEILGPDGMARAIVVAATSDQSALQRRRCAWTAMTIAEFFREEGRDVLLVADSITRFAEAHRDIALATGELPALRGFPASTAQMIMSLCERAGPGVAREGSITAIFSVLVAGSDFDEPVADILRGVLDGHVVLDRQIAERGRFPAIDILRSTSRSLPQAATDAENEMLRDARQLLGAYQRAEVMIKSGLYTEGSDPDVDRAIRAWDELDSFVARMSEPDIAASFDRLKLILRRAGSRPQLAG